MADSIANAAGTGVTVTIRGEDYKIRPLTVRDLAEFESYVRSKRIKALIGDGAAEGLLPEERTRLVRDLASTPPSTEEVSAEMSTLGGVAFLLWRMLRKDRPGLTLVEASELVGMDNLQEVSAVIEAVSGTDEGNPTAGAGPASGSAGTTS